MAGAIQRQRRRGTAAENAAFTGAVGEFTFLTDSKRIAAHDGTTLGGFVFPNINDILTQALTRATASGTNTYTATIAGFPAAYANGQRITITFTNANSGASTLNINGIGAAAIQDEAGVALSSGAITAAGTKDLVYNSGASAWRFSPSTASSTGRLLATTYFTASGTYSKATNNPSFIEVEVIGGGGGGGGSGTGGTGGTTSFGSHCSATGGVGGTTDSQAGNVATSGGDGGTGSGGDLNTKGQAGAGGQGNGSSSGAARACMGGSGGGEGGGKGAAAGAGSWAGSAGGANTGGGGGGGMTTGTTATVGGGGGQGGRSRKRILATSLSASETVTIGAGGTSAGGSVGGTGLVIVREYA